MRTIEEEKKVYGYVVYIRAYATADNQSYETGTLSVYYGGIKKSFLGYEVFEPYKSEVSAKKGWEAWEDIISPMTVEEFSKRVDVLGIRDWKEHYEPVDVMVLDGE